MGKEHLERLAHDTLTALKGADLAEELALLDARVFSRSPEELFDGLTDEQPTFSYKPMVELLLLHLREVAAETTRPAKERRREVRWAIEVAGF